MKLLDSKTFENLAQAFAGECQARTRYEFIEYGARKQGYKALAEVVDKVAYNEFNHARMFYTFMQKATDDLIENVPVEAGYPFKEKWDLVENLSLAAEDELFEAEKIYPEFAAVAKKEGFDDVARLFTNVAGVEMCHHKLFLDLYEQLSGGTLYVKKKPVKWKCGDCGYEATATSAWTVCPICEAKQGAVMLHLSDG